MAGIPTGQSRMKKYIFFLDQPNTESMLLADAQLRKTGVRVLSHYGSAAVVGLARKEHVEAAYRTGLFDAATSGPVSDESLELCDPDQLEAAYLWNSIHPARLHDGREDLPEEEGEWHELNPFLEQIPYDLRKFKEELLRVLQIDEPALLEKYRDTEMPDSGGEDFVAFEDKLARKFDDPTKAYHLARAARHLKPAYRQALLDLPLPLPNDDPPLPELIPWRMQGKVAVGIIYVESTPPIGPDFSSDERNWISAQLTEGMDWLAANAPDGAGLTWVRHVQHIKIDEPEQPGKPADYWLVPAMGKISFAGNSYAPSLESLSDYCEHMRAQYSCDYAFAILVTPYATSGPVDIPVKYTFAGRHITFVNDKSFGMTGKYQHLHRFMIREMCKVFEAADERWPCSSDSRHGYYNIPNGNCNKYSCIMRSASDLTLCDYTQAHIGWADLFVEVTTADKLWAGTDDLVVLDLGAFREWLPAEDDDLERGNVDGFAFNYTGLTRDDVERVMLYKQESSFGPGTRWLSASEGPDWTLQRVRVWVQGELLCDEGNIRRELSFDNCWWVSSNCGTSSTIVNSLEVRVTTADEFCAGTDDDVTLEIHGIEWNLDNSWRNDFERGNTDTFKLIPSPAIYTNKTNGIAIRKSPDSPWGFGGWKLKGVKVIANGDVLYDNQSINVWLEEDDREWTDLMLPLPS